MTDPVAALRAILPAGVVVAGGRVAALDTALWPGEGLPAAARPLRRAEFAAGRSAARAALAAAGLPPVALPRDNRGLPMWPEGITGCITHAGGWALAAVTRLPAGLGIDAEQADATLPLADIATAEEAAAGPDPIRLFSAKEAAYKAQFPRSGALLAFTDLEIRFAGDGFAARFLPDVPPFSTGTLLHGRQARAAGLILSAVVF